MDSPRSGAENPACDDACPVCGGSLVTKKLKRFCRVCGTLCETCCDNGRP